MEDNVMHIQMIKMSHIGVINQLEVSLEKQATLFGTLDQKTIEELEKIRDGLIPEYNEMVKAKKFAAEMIYK